MSKAENPPAFPEVPGDSNGYEGRPGMNLRDWFAGQVAAALCSAADNTGMWTGLIDDETGYRVVAERSYRMADAMLAERAKGGGV